MPEEIEKYPGGQIAAEAILGVAGNDVKLQQEKFEVEKLKSNLTEQKENVEDKRDNLQKLNEQLEQKLFNFQKLYEEELLTKREADLLYSTISKATLGQFSQEQAIRAAILHELLERLSYQEKE